MYKKSALVLSDLLHRLDKEASDLIEWTSIFNEGWPDPGEEGYAPTRQVFYCTDKTPVLREWVDTCVIPKLREGNQQGALVENGIGYVRTKSTVLQHAHRDMRVANVPVHEDGRARSYWSVFGAVNMDLPGGYWSTKLLTMPYGKVAR